MESTHLRVWGEAGYSQGLKESVCKVHSASDSQLVTHPSEVGLWGWAPSWPAKEAFPSGEREGDLSLHLLPIECFPSPEFTGRAQAPQIRNTWATEAAGLGVHIRHLEQHLESGAVTLTASCPWLSLAEDKLSFAHFPSIPKASRPALKRDSR